VILATGHRPRVNAFLPDASPAYDESGTPLCSGRETAISGLYYCGYSVSPTGMLRDIAREARHISGVIARKCRGMGTDARSQEPRAARARGP
jgi:hypothetical protein